MPPPLSNSKAEEDCKVLLGAVDIERSEAGRKLTDMEANVRDISAKLSGEKLR